MSRVAISLHVVAFARAREEGRSTASRTQAVGMETARARRGRPNSSAGNSRKAKRVAAGNADIGGGLVAGLAFVYLSLKDRYRSPSPYLELAIERNAVHGLQLSQEDKRDMARRIYAATPERERDAKKTTLARILSVSDRTIRAWLGRMDKDAKEARNKRIFEMWMACATLEDIAAATDVTKETASQVCQNLAELPKSDKASSEHATDFDPPLYNIWKQQEKTSGSKHFGNSEVRWLDNLLYFYTQPFDVIVDPFAGGGSTIDLCKRRFRRYWVSDRKPIVEREKEIRRSCSRPAEVAATFQRGSE